VYVDEFDDGGDWQGWFCAPSVFDLGAAVEESGEGVMSALDGRRMDCGAVDIVVDVDLVVDIAFEDTAAPADIIASNEAVIVNLRAHRLDDQEPLWITNELDLSIAPKSATEVTARFITVGPVREGDVDLLTAASVAQRSAGVSVLDPASPMRLRARAEGQGPTSLRVKVWRASDPEPPEWLIETTLAQDSAFDDDDYGLSLSLAATDAAPVRVHFDHFATYHAESLSADDRVPLPPR
jgi:hypothetical protein